MDDTAMIQMLRERIDGLLEIQRDEAGRLQDVYERLTEATAEVARLREVLNGPADARPGPMLIIESAYGVNTAIEECAKIAVAGARGPMPGEDVAAEFHTIFAGILGDEPPADMAGIRAGFIAQAIRALKKPAIVRPPTGNEDALAATAREAEALAARLEARLGEHQRAAARLFVALGMTEREPHTWEYAMDQAESLTENVTRLNKERAAAETARDNAIVRRDAAIAEVAGLRDMLATGPAVAASREECARELDEYIREHPTTDSEREMLLTLAARLRRPRP